jgi:hypothetical protein
LLRLLAEHRVEFVVVGGIAAVLQGAPIATFDLDIVHRRSPENIERLLAVLREIGARYRGQGDRRLVPDASMLGTPGHHLLMTDSGPLDLLGTIGSGRDYDALLSSASTVTLEESLAIQLLDLPTVISTKEEANRDKDRAVLAVLRRTLEEKNRR